MAADNEHLIAYQGQPGANSDMACRAVHPDMEPLPCPSFEDVFAAVRANEARLAMIPIENSAAGRVADIHHLLPDSELHIIAEHFQPIHHHLLGVKGAKIDNLQFVSSHHQALSQCRETIRSMGLEPQVHADTAGAAKDLAAIQTQRTPQSPPTWRPTSTISKFCTAIWRTISTTRRGLS